MNDPTPEQILERRQAIDQARERTGGRIARWPIETIRKLKEQGRGRRAIAAELGVSEWLVRRVLAGKWEERQPLFVPEGRTALAKSDRCPGCGGKTAWWPCSKCVPIPPAP